MYGNCRDGVNALNRAILISTAVMFLIRMRPLSLCQCPQSGDTHFYPASLEPAYLAAFRARFCRHFSEYSDNWPKTGLKVAEGKLYFFKYIFGVFYVVIIVAFCNRINTDAASPPNTEVMVHWYEKEAGSGSFRLQNINTLSLNTFQIVENHSVFVFGQVIYKNTNEGSTVFITNIEQEIIETIQPIFLPERIYRIGPRTILQQVS